ncbi:MAG: ABC transporter permease [Actinomycetota bacterium]
MPAYVVKRLLSAVVVLWAILTLVFIAGRFVGDPAHLILGAEAEATRVAALRAELGLDQPLIDQYMSFLRGASTGDFGISYWQSVPAMDLVMLRLPPTLYLSAVAIAVSVPLAVLAGVFAAWKPDSLIDRGTSILSLATASVVEFWLALMLILAFAVHLGWFPTSGYKGFGIDGLQYLILPAVVLSLRPIGRIAQVTRSAIGDELNKPYITAARARGFGDRRLLLRHGLRNSLIPVITLSGDELISMVGGLVVLETIFAWPGVGQLTVQAIERRDLPTIEAVVFVVGVMVVIINLVVDLIYAYINPRIRY